MLQRNQRFVLYFDFSMAPYPSDAPPIDLNDLLPELKKRCGNSIAVEEIDAGRRIIRLMEMKDIKLGDGSTAASLLLCLGDREKADAGVTNIKTGGVRIFEKKEDEVGGLSVHVLLHTAPTKPGSHLYRMVMEDVTGFGRTLVQNFFRSQFKAICDDHEFSFKRDDKKNIKTRPMVELHGHASQQLKDSLQEGRLLHIELIDYVEQDFGFDEAIFIKTARRNLNLSISGKLPDGEALTVVEKVKAWANGQGYSSMRVRWKDPSSTKPQSAKIDTTKMDAGEAFFIRTAEVKFTTPLADISEKISDEIIEEMRKLLVS
ncbi:hypothetical protein [Phyllobacterium leguminum]|uniref:Uncharacterized protein n=1 Tax=Phyllobacterium leguminum TaxID=314237 RepID=A0A318SYL9_9HYPH|nr:hypothetical protein [Phyllobacterium leguminum]PYE86553.1 hypothetical protein C7477_12345 [Phyllobacterium leguminum]